MLSDEERDRLLETRPHRTIKKDHIENLIAKREFMVIDGGTLTICVLTLKNGFQVTGESACAHPGNFNVLLGEKIAYDKAFDKIWPLEGYLLKEVLYQESLKQAQ